MFVLRNPEVGARTAASVRLGEVFDAAVAGSGCVLLVVASITGDPLRALPIPVLILVPIGLFEGARFGWALALGERRHVRIGPAGVYGLAGAGIAMGAAVVVAALCGIGAMLALLPDALLTGRL